MTVVEIIGWLLFPQAFKSVVVNTETVVKSFLFIPCYCGNDAIRPVYGLGWTLNLELFFYLLGFIALKINAKYRHWILTALLMMFIAIGEIFHPQQVLLKFWCTRDLYGFLAGIWVYIVESKMRRKNTKANLFAMVGLVVMFFFLFFHPYLFDENSNFFVWILALESGLILWSMYYFKNSKCPRFLVLMGDISYSVYMTHFFVVGVVCRLWMKDAQITPQNTMIVFLAIVGALLSSWIVYQIFEIRLASWIYGKIRWKESR